ncbi:MAG TPA: radical SAM family heme chaperone HemW, partial [Candidatus Marinimicrobia bacterium]|nr:radical SAM family heme chaperone HemW [Candidatus Neomarinimicrobiota bacterium]
MVEIVAHCKLSLLKKISLYLHIPFCAQRCHYCDFYSSTKISSCGEQFLESIRKELVWQKNRFQESVQLQTIYFGGGTPNLFAPGALLSLLETISRNFLIRQDCEITIEMNPEFVPNAEGLQSLREGGFNRISIGAQSANDNELRFLGRIHSHESTLKAVDAARKAAFENICLDLIWNIPGQTEKQLQHTLETFIELEPSHISAYSLSAEEGTPYAALIENGEIAENPETIGNIFFEQVHDELEKAGFEHYEISNFSQAGKRSKHNQSYWLGDDYLGLGPSAHSKLGKRRFWHDAKLLSYIEKASKNDFTPDGDEEITRQIELEELILLRLRTKEGLKLTDFTKWEREKLLY